MTTTDQTEAANIDLVSEFPQRVLTEKDLDAADELLADDYTEHNPAFPNGVLRGRDNLVEFWESLFVGFPDLWTKSGRVRGG